MKTERANRGWCGRLDKGILDHAEGEADAFGKVAGMTADSHRKDRPVTPDTIVAGKDTRPVTEVSH